MQFKIRITRTIDQLNAVSKIRAESYAKHIPTMLEQLQLPEKIDFKNSNITLTCEEISSMQVVGSLRITLNQFEPLPLESIFKLCSSTRHTLNAEVTRLVVPPRRNAKYIKLLLMKALYLYCHALQVKWMLICARKPLDKEYVNLGFVDISQDKLFVEVPYIGNIPHRALGFNVISAERLWHQQNHPLYQFMVEESHPEIQIFDSVKSSWENPRLRNENTTGQLTIDQLAESPAIPPFRSRH